MSRSESDDDGESAPLLADVRDPSTAAGLSLDEPPPPAPTAGSFSSSAAAAAVFGRVFVGVGVGGGGGGDTSESAPPPSTPPTSEAPPLPPLPALPALATLLCLLWPGGDFPFNPKEYTLLPPPPPPPLAPPPVTPPPSLKALAAAHLAAASCTAYSVVFRVWATAEDGSFADTFTAPTAPTVAAVEGGGDDEASSPSPRYLAVASDCLPIQAAAVAGGRGGAGDNIRGGGVTSSGSTGSIVKHAVAVAVARKSTREVYRECRQGAVADAGDDCSPVLYPPTPTDPTSERK